MNENVLRDKGYLVLECEGDSLMKCVWSEFYPDESKARAKAEELVPKNFPVENRTIYVLGPVTRFKAK